MAIAASGLLATIELDATGLFGGTFDLTMSEVPGAPTELLRIVGQDVEAIGLTVNDGRVTVIPEPAGLGVFALAPLFRRRRA